jgi:hypothetical protein
MGKWKQTKRRTNEAIVAKRIEQEKLIKAKKPDCRLTGNRHGGLLSLIRL